MSFVDFLYEKNIINHDLYELATNKFENADAYICDILISGGEFSEDSLAKLKSEFFGLKYTDLSNFSKIADINYEELESSFTIPFEVSDEYTHIAISDPNDFEAKNNINYNLTLCEETRNTKPIYYVASKNKIKRKFQEISNVNCNTVDKIIFDAISKSASDIHITPFEKTFKIMLRIDGTLTDYKTSDINEFERLKISIKVLSKLDIAETRRPQSGHFQKDNIDFRVSTHPTSYGENVVIRILNKDKSIISIEKIGFSAAQIEYLKNICSFSNGMIIFCGPTGSGKTTSIYSLIETMDKKSRNIMTLEDPIEYKISNVRQTEILSGVINFAEGVRSILRQDPDVILIGEIRDKETAQMAIRASMTGHLVLSTIHANNSFGAISRLQEFNIANSLIADNIISIISQRLIRKKSRNGRTIISEILNITPKLKEFIYNKCNTEELKNIAMAENFKSLFDDCKSKIDDEIIDIADAQNILRN